MSVSVSEKSFDVIQVLILQNSVKYLLQYIVKYFAKFYGQTCDFVSYILTESKNQNVGEKFGFVGCKKF